MPSAPVSQVFYKFKFIRRVPFIRISTKPGIIFSVNPTSFKERLTGLQLAIA